MKSFSKGIFTGLFTGIIIKDQVYNLIKIGLILFHEVRKISTRKQINIDGINNIDFICKITDFELFNELFPNNMGKYKVQPQWEYFDKLNVIKTKLDQELIDYLNKLTNLYEDKTFNLEEFFDLKDNLNERFISLYLPFFKKIGTYYIYINYTYLGKKYINIYDSSSTIDIKDFKVKNSSKFDGNFDNILCSNIKYNNDHEEKTEYISSYLKKFYNNKNPLTLELLLLNYHLNINLKKVKLIIIKNNEIKELNLNEII